MDTRLVLVMGIIPADAGSTLGLDDGGRQTPDHPRGCGEHSLPFHSWMPVTGSSPRMRGARGPVLQGPSCGRIIPADAGSTSKEARRIMEHEDHPRGCGEHAHLV